VAEGRNFGPGVLTRGMSRRLFPVLLAAIAAILVALNVTGDDPSGGSGARVVRVVDGDTIRVSVHGREQPVRLLGIDTPETHRPGTPIECGGPQASAYMERLAPAGTPVTLERDPSQDSVDRYGRQLAYVRLPDGRLAEDAEVAAGWATVYVYGGKPVSRDAQFRRSQAAAREARRGVWAACEGDFHSSRR
jgi:micrococcal nuclease